MQSVSDPVNTGNYKNTVLKKIIALSSVILLYAFVYNEWVKFPYKFLIIIAAVCTLCLIETGNLSEIGLSRKGSPLKMLRIVLLLFLVIEPVMDFLVQPLVNMLTGEVADYSVFGSLEGNTAKYSKYLLYVWISAAFGEEIFFRGFLFRQLDTLIPFRKGKAIFIALLSSFLFALPHFYQGLGGAIITFLFGLLFSWTYIKFRYNLWIPILLHGLVDSLFITLAYWGKLDYYEFANRVLWGY